MKIATAGIAVAWLQVRRWRDGMYGGIVWDVAPGESSQTVRRSPAGVNIEPGLSSDIMALGVYPQSLYVVTVGKEKATEGSGE